MKRTSVLLLVLLSGCRLADLLRTPEPPPKECTIDIYWYRIDPLTQQRVDSAWAGTWVIPCPTEK